MKMKLVRRMCLMIMIFAALTGCGAGRTESDSEVPETKQDEAVESISENGSLSIAMDDLSETVQFYPIELDGISMEVMAAKDETGELHLAYNTCQVCYSSGNGYYKQENDQLVCQNCGNRFNVDQLGQESGGCNPIPITASDYNTAGERIEIPYSFLAQYEGAFR